jgi:hypothetical protein
MRKSLLASKTPVSSNGANGYVEGGRCTNFVAMVDHADLVDTSGLKFHEHVNKDGARVFEMKTSVRSFLVKS